MWVKLTKYWFILVLCWIGMLPASVLAENNLFSVGFYFPPNQFSKAQFQYTQTLLAPEIEIVPFYANRSEQKDVLVSGYDNTYHLVAHVENAHSFFAVVLGVNQVEGAKLEQLRCHGKPSCTPWIYINENASYQRLKHLASALNGEHQLVTVTKDKAAAQQLTNQWPELKIIQHNDSIKEFELIKQASRQGDVYVMLPDDAFYNDATGRVVLQFLFQQRLISVGFSSGSFKAGAMVASYADYSNMLLTAKLKFLNYRIPEQSMYLNACYQDYYINEALLARVYGEAYTHIVDSDSLYQLAKQLNDDCNKNLDKN
ncbi:hypothetical protein DS2_08143 [Catenovulum agarivorans DS-2]|uniref:Uncharacterized protein n=1 Tax=Catenovulum agarivorans DS-2 TaxID=1328313 RepID=W7QES6_9ALTE|nr:hypothetical protein [Catenovulum agarivorans]EWH10426.1 hypothetical protein DS2_08143 [Catenovulum agarivorans DS-2]